MNALLECVLCEAQFSETDIESYSFFPQTRICYKCYRKLQKAPYIVSCFGKKTESSIKLGFDPNAHECRELCPDRKLCPHFANGTIKSLRQGALVNVQEVASRPRQVVTIRAYPFRTGSIADKAFKLCQVGVTKDKFKRWCMRQGTNMYRLLRAFRKEERNGRQWRWKEKGNHVEIEYPLR